MNLMSWDNQTNDQKTIALQAIDKVNQVKQGSKAKKSLKNDRKKKKKKSHYKQHEKPSPTTTRGYDSPALDNED